MEPEMLLKLLAVVAGVVLLLVVNFVDFNSLLDRILLKKTPLKSEKKDVEFLHIVDLWYQLRASCEKNSLAAAVKKIDEVFPLLNKSSEN